MNDNPDLQNSSLARYSNQRLAQSNPPTQAELDNGIEEPVREDLEQDTVKKPPVKLARRPVPITQPSNTRTDLRGPKVLPPPFPSRQTNPISTGAATATPKARPAAAVPPSAGARFEAPLPRSHQPGRTPITPQPVSLPTGIQRGFPNTPSPTNGSGHGGAQSPVAPLRPEPSEVTRGYPEPESEKPVEVEENVQGPSQAEKVVEEQDARPQSAPFLEEVLDRLATPPAQTAILGVCDDGLPVLLDLNDPVPGAILVVSDDDMLRTRLLHTLLQTSAVLNSPRSVQFLILSTHPEEWQTWMAGQEITRHCMGVERLPDRGEDVVVEGSPERWLIN